MAKHKHTLSLLKFIPWSDSVPESPIQSSASSSGSMIELPGPSTRLNRTSFRFLRGSKSLAGELVNGNGTVFDTLANLGVAIPGVPVSENPAADGFSVDPLAKVLSYDGKLLVTDAPGGFSITHKGREPIHLPLVSAGLTDGRKAFISGFEEGMAVLDIEGEKQMRIAIPEEVQHRRIFYVVAVENGTIWVKGDADLLQYDLGGNLVEREILDESTYLEKLVPRMWEIKDVAGGDGNIYLSCSGGRGIAVLRLGVGE